MTKSEFREEMLGIIDDRLYGVDNINEAIEKEMQRGNNRSVVRRVEWLKHTRDVNLKWKAVLLNGRFARYEQ